MGKNNYKLICIAITGSHAYGMQRENSDFDIMGLFIPSIDYILGIKKIKHIKIEKQLINKTEVEGTIYNLDQWFDLLIGQNPNIIELLWHSDNMYIYRDDLIWPLLFNNRDKFLSKRAARSFSSYAHAQFNRLSSLNEGVNKNKERLEQFKKFGYSTKNASHLFRLLNMCLEILVEKIVVVLRPDRQLLLSILDGKYSLDEISKIVDEKTKLIDEAYVRSNLRENIDLIMANNLLKDIYIKYLSNNFIKKRSKFLFWKL